MLSARRLGTISGGGTERSCTSVSGRGRAPRDGTVTDNCASSSRTEWRISCLGGGAGSPCPSARTSDGRCNRCSNGNPRSRGRRHRGACRRFFVRTFKTEKAETSGQRAGAAYGRLISHSAFSISGAAAGKLDVKDYDPACDGNNLNTRIACAGSPTSEKIYFQTAAGMGAAARS